MPSGIEKCAFRIGLTRSALNQSLNRWGQILMSKSELQTLLNILGLPLTAVAALLDVEKQTLARWLSGARPMRHPAMVRKALQMCILEQRGIVTAKLVERMEVK